MKDFLFNIILSVTVFAALITSITNVIISLINNYRLKKMEDKKQVNEIDKYRYSRLYELVANWYNYDTKVDEATPERMASYRLLNLFIDDSGRYEIAKPLLDKYYIENLESKKSECEKLLEALVDAESPDGTHTKDFQSIKEKYYKSGIEFSKLLKSAINSQLESLLRKSDIR